MRNDTCAWTPRLADLSCAISVIQLPHLMLGTTFCSAICSNTNIISAIDAMQPNLLDAIYAIHVVAP